MGNERAKLRLWQVIAAAAMVVATIAVFMIWQGISISLRAENTLHAYSLCLDLLEDYIKENQKWPDSWEALATVRPKESSIWDWPNDIGAIRKRVEIDFSLRLDQVAAMRPDSFSAVKQIGPNYGVDEAEIRQLIALADNASK
jgi:hypothetical protein